MISYKDKCNGRNKVIECERERLIIWKMPFKTSTGVWGYIQSMHLPLQSYGGISVKTVFPVKMKEIVFRTVSTH